jgi:putative ABC transport system ATP-binding protein
MNNGSWIKTVDLCRYYRRGHYEVRALDGVNIDISRGEFVGIVGPSGSGKSTILNLLASLDRPTSGLIEIDGRSLFSHSRKELAGYRAHKVAMIFQSFNLIPHYTALQNVEMALYFNDTPNRERKKRATEILERLGMGDRITHRPADLSGGEQQRVAVARAIVKKPEILFADEPTGNLDHDNSLQIGDLLRELNKDSLTIIMVTHNIDLARQHANRIIRMDYGKISSEERP